MINRSRKLVFSLGALHFRNLFRGAQLVRAFSVINAAPLHGKTFGEITLEDFATFDKAGLARPDLSRMKQALGDLGSNAPSQ